MKENNVYNLIYHPKKDVLKESTVTKIYADKNQEVYDQSDVDISDSDSRRQYSRKRKYCNIGKLKNDPKSDGSTE
uniref:Uncharacterized protein n=1 Tax=Panagrolaimus sp. ES5 TaxID=591445 RepID=A0AC34G6V0_9BILA